MYWYNLAVISGGSLKEMLEISVYPIMACVEECRHSSDPQRISSLCSNFFLFGGDLFSKEARCTAKQTETQKKLSQLKKG